MPGYTHGRRVEVTKKRKPETLREIIEPGPKRQNTAIQEAPVRQPSLLHEDERNERQAFTKQQSGLGDTKWRPKWWNNNRTFKHYFFQCVGFEYMDAGEFKFAEYFECLQFRKNKAKPRLCPAKFMSIIDIPHHSNVLYNAINNHLYKGQMWKELCWSSWLDQVQKYLESQGQDVPEIGPKTYATYNHVCDLIKFTKTFFFATRKQRKLSVWTKVAYRLNADCLQNPCTLHAVANNTAQSMAVKTGNDERDYPLFPVLHNVPEPLQIIFRDLQKRIRDHDKRFRDHEKRFALLEGHTPQIEEDLDEWVFIEDQKRRKCEDAELDLCHWEARAEKKKCVTHIVRMYH